MTLQCPRCGGNFPNETALYSHLKSLHRLPDSEIRKLGIGGQGWYEPQQQVMTDKGLEQKSPDHYAVSNRPKSHPITVPIIPAEKEEQVQLSPGWKQTTDGFVFEQTVYEHTDAENSTKKIVNADLNHRTGRALLYTYRKNTCHIADLVEKKNLLLGRLSARTPSDNEYVEIAAELNRCTHEISEAKKCTKTEPPDVEVVLEETSKFESFSNENKTWQTEFMKKVSEEANRLSKVNQDHDIGRK